MTLKLELNQPVEGVLKYQTGKVFPSKFPGRADCVMYSLADGNCFYLDKGICDEPDALFRDQQVTVGKPFRLTLRKTQIGAKYYEVQRIDPYATVPTNSGFAAANTRQQNISTPEPPSKLESQLAASIDHIKAQRAPRLQGQPAEPTKERTPENTMQGGTKAALVMAAALIAAIDAGRIAEQYAAKHNISLQWCEGDYRAIAATLYIQACKDPLFALQQSGGQEPWKETRVS